MTPVAERFWSYVEMIPFDTCWEWVGPLNSKGYGQFQHAEKRQAAHRYAYEAVVGSISEGLTLDHLCRNRSCVNPADLEPVCPQDALSTRPRVACLRISFAQGPARLPYLHLSQCPSPAPLCLTYDGGREVSEREIQRIAEKFRRDMRKLGLGVRIRTGDGDWVEIAKPPKKRPADAPSSGDERPTEGTGK